MIGNGSAREGNGFANLNGWPCTWGTPVGTSGGIDSASTMFDQAVYGGGANIGLFDSYYSYFYADICSPSTTFTFTGTLPTIV